MARLIETEKAWKTAQRIYSDPVLLNAIKNVLDSTAAEDAVRVVRCKDCKHPDWNGSVPYCPMHGFYMYAEGFCSDGEMEENM